MQSRGRLEHRAGWMLAASIGMIVMTTLGPATAFAVTDTTDPAAPVETAAAPTEAPEMAPPETPAPTEPPVAEATEPTEPAAVTEPTAAVATTVVPEPTVDTGAPASVAPATEAAPTTEPTASTVEPDCAGTVDGDGPVVLPDGCDPAAASAAASNPTLSPTCGLSATIVVDRSASIDASAARAAVGAVVDGLVDTGSVVTLIDTADDASVRIGAAELTGDSRGSFDGYSPAVGGRSNLAAGLAAAQPTDLTIVVTDGVINAGGTTPADALSAAADAANRLKGAGSHVFAIGVGTVDTAGLAAITGGGEGSDAGASDYTVGNLAAVSDRLNALAGGGCLMVSAAAADDLLVTPLALVDQGNTGAIAVPATGSADQRGSASPYPSNITVSGQSGLVTDVDVHLFGVTHSSGADFDILLVGPGGQNLIVLSDAGPANALVTFTNASITLDDSAAAGATSGGTFAGPVNWKPTNNASGPADSYPAPAPVPSGNTTLLGAFSGTNPNGTWSLYVVDGRPGDIGSISGGWSLTITTEEAAVATTTTVTTSGSPSFVGGSVAFTATVRNGAAPVTAGAVTFTDGASMLGTVNLNASGVASLSTSTLVEGTHTIGATFNGSPGLLPSNGTVSQIVDTPTTNPATGQFCNTGPITGPGGATAFGGAASPYPSRVTVSGLGTVTTLVTVQLGGVTHEAPIDFDILLVSPTNQNLMLMSDVGGQEPASVDSLTFADSASGQIPSNSLAGGTYKPTDDDVASADAALPAPAPVVSSATTLATFNTFNPNGVWQLFVVDDATGDAGAINGGWCLNVSTAVATTTVLTSSANPVDVGQPVTLTAAVTAGSSPATAGTVTFREGATMLGTGSVDSSGLATFTTSTLIVGTHSLTAEYAGTSAFQASSGTLSQVVRLVPTATALTSSRNPAFVGESVTLTATVTSPGPVSAGSVTFRDGATLLGTVTVSSGQAALTTDALTSGLHSIAASYSGTPTLAASNDALDQTITTATSNTDLTSSSNPSFFGQTVTFTATVAITNGPNVDDPATGTVTFSVDGTDQPPVPLDANGRATFTTSALSVGVHPVAADYNGTAGVGDSSDELDQTVSSAATTTAVTSSVNPSVFGQSVTFTATVTIASGPATGQPAAGAVAFTDGPTSLGGPVALNGSGQAELTISSLVVGTHPITATYDGATGVIGSSDSVDQVVGNAASATALTSSANPSAFGNPVTLTATVTITSGAAAGTPATGAVTFNDGTTGTVLGTVTLVAGQAAVTTSALAVGSHSISASYDGTTGVVTSTASLDQVVDGVADAGGPYAIDEGQALALDGSASLAGPGATYSWDVNGDGTFGDATGVTPTLMWSRLEELGLDGDDPPGLHPVTLQLTEGPAFTAITNLAIANVAPTATSLTNDGPAVEGSTATVTVDGATDPSARDVAGLVYRFDFGDDGTVDVEGADPTVTVPGSFLPNGPGTLDVSAVVADPDGGESAALTTTITITNAAARATIDGPSTAVVGMPVTIKVGAVDPSPDDMAGTFQFTVDWGDGTPPVTVPGPADPPVTHTYTAAGTFTVIATVVDPDGAVSEPLEFTMTVTEQVTPSTTSTTTPGATTTTVPGTLPATGSSSSTLVLIALALLGAGAAAFIATRTVRAASSGPRGNHPGH